MDNELYTCLADNTTHLSLKELHNHVRFNLKLKQEDYYHRFLPRRDLLTDALIPFKEVEQYLSSDFINKINMKRWFKENPEAAKGWSINWLTQRKEKKGLTYAPTQVELRTLQCPSMDYYQASFSEGYYPLTESLGYEQRYLNMLPMDSNRQSLPVDSKIIQDTREQKPLKLEVPTVVGTLNVGDYSLDEPNDKGIRIERKSLSDFCGSLSERKIDRVSSTDTHFDRIDRELARAKEQGLYVIMLVESDINTSQSFNHLPHLKFIKASPSYIFHNLRTLLVRYPLHFQCAFIDGRKEMANIIPNILGLGELAKQIDIQYSYEKGLLL